MRNLFKNLLTHLLLLHKPKLHRKKSKKQFAFFLLYDCSFAEMQHYCQSAIPLASFRRERGLLSVNLRLKI